ncbi:hypothetical protein L1987_29340 [Smallanthus sonchifolius]|uniref:Uncharacterized protein n=1 Tax=Smallanthus sonchifolius TaxID=185202 RepID=A0ACB9I196_9ASTR|nr:hypothetical protein L1987_29340 [Smallanthus sonchifolius]
MFGAGLIVGLLFKATNWANKSTNSITPYPQFCQLISPINLCSGIVSCKLAMSNRRPVIGELITSPTTPLEFKVLSPTGIINRNMGGIGLGIVAALGNKRMLSDPVPVIRSRTGGDRGMMDEDYTIVTSNIPNKLFRKVYHGGKKIDIRGKDCIFNISPARFGDDDMRVPQPPDFLDSCHLCNKKLHGKDIYMYRGEKAFCSPECRSRQIAMDERPEKYCSSQASSSGANRVIAATGIFAI